MSTGGKTFPCALWVLRSFPMSQGLRFANKPQKGTQWRCPAIPLADCWLPSFVLNIFHISHPYHFDWFLALFLTVIPYTNSVLYSDKFLPYKNSDTDGTPMLREVTQVESGETTAQSQTWLQRHGAFCLATPPCLSFKVYRAWDLKPLVNFDLMRSIILKIYCQ